MYNVQRTTCTCTCTPDLYNVQLRLRQLTFTFTLQHVALQLRTLLHKCWSTCVPCGSFLLQLHWPEHVITTRAARTTMDPIGAMRKTMYVTTAMR